MISCLKKKKRLRCPLPSLPCGCWVLSVGLGEALGPRGLEGGCCVCEKARDGGGAKGTGSLALGEAPVRVFSSGALAVTETALSHTRPGSSGGAVGRDARCPQRWGPQGLDPRAVLRSL